MLIKFLSLCVGKVKILQALTLLLLNYLVILNFHFFSVKALYLVDFSPNTLEIKLFVHKFSLCTFQPAVEAFFLVHASSIEKESREESGGTTASENTRAETNNVNTSSQELAPVSPLPGEGEASSSSNSSSSTSSSVHPVAQASPQPLNSSLETAQPLLLSADTRKFLKFAGLCGLSHQLMHNCIVKHLL